MTKGGTAKRNKPTPQAAATAITANQTGWIRPRSAILSKISSSGVTVLDIKKTGCIPAAFRSRPAECPARRQALRPDGKKCLYVNFRKHSTPCTQVPFAGVTKIPVKQMADAGIKRACGIVEAASIPHERVATGRQDAFYPYAQQEKQDIRGRSRGAAYRKTRPCAQDQTAPEICI